jgi:nucleotide-binding universal stress UspA family protein
MIKGKAPFPFQTLALAVSFSPGLPSMVAEMRRLADIHGSMSLFIHVGKKTSEKHRDLSQLLSGSGFHDGNSRIYWEHGDVVPNLLRICKHEVVDLLLLGASERNDFALPPGSVTREIATKAKCSVLVFASPPASHSVRKILVNGNDTRKSESTLLTAVFFAEKEKAEELLVVEDLPVNLDSNRATEEVETETTVLSKLIRETTGRSKVSIQPVSLSEYKGVSDFAFRNQADLIVTNTSDHRLLIFDRINKEDGIESLINTLPCNLLIVHSRVQD